MNSQSERGGLEFLEKRFQRDKEPVYVTLYVAKGSPRVDMDVDGPEWFTRENLVVAFRSMIEATNEDNTQCEDAVR